MPRILSFIRAFYQNATELMVSHIEHQTQCDSSIVANILSNNVQVYLTTIFSLKGRNAYLTMFSSNCNALNWTYPAYLLGMLLLQYFNLICTYQLFPLCTFILSVLFMKLISTLPLHRSLFFPLIFRNLAAFIMICSLRAKDYSVNSTTDSVLLCLSHGFS